MEWVPDLRQLRSFIAVAEEGSFTLAARRLYVTQSAVSHSMRTLEEQLECRLLDRTGKKAVLTAEGEMLFKRCKKVIHELDQATSDLDSLRRWGQTRIRIGTPHSLCLRVIPAVLREFKDCFPRCEPIIETGDTLHLLDLLALSELDIVLGIRARNQQYEGYRKLFSDQLNFVVSSFHPWVVAPEASDHFSLKDQQLILYGKSAETESVLEAWLQENPYSSKKPLFLNDMQAIKEMAKLGIGVGLIAPWIAKEEIESGELVVIKRAQNDTKIKREWGVFCSNRRDPTLVEEAFIGLCEMAFYQMQ